MIIEYVFIHLHDKVTLDKYLRVTYMLANLSDKRDKQSSQHSHNNWVS